MKKTLSVLFAVLLLLSALSCAVSAADNYTNSFSVTMEESSAERMAIIPVLVSEDGQKILDHFGSYIVDNKISRRLVTPDKLTFDEDGNPVFDFNEVYKSVDDSEKEQFLKDNADFFTFIIEAPGALIFYQNKIDGNGLLMVENKSPLIPQICYVPEGKNFVFTLASIGSYRFDQTTCVKAFPAGFETNILQGEVLGETVEPDANQFYTLFEVSGDTVLQAYNLQAESISGVKDFLMNMGKFFRDLIAWFFGLFVRT